MELESQTWVLEKCMNNTPKRVFYCLLTLAVVDFVFVVGCAEELLKILEFHQYSWRKYVYVVHTSKLEQRLHIYAVAKSNKLQFACFLHLKRLMPPIMDLDDAQCHWLLVKAIESSRSCNCVFWVLIDQCWHSKLEMLMSTHLWSPAKSPTCDTCIAYRNENKSKRVEIYFFPNKWAQNRFAIARKSISVNWIEHRQKDLALLL